MVTNTVLETPPPPEAKIKDELNVRFFEALLQWDKRIFLEPGEVPSDLKRIGMLALAAC